MTCGVSGFRWHKVAGENVPIVWQFSLFETGQGQPESDSCLLVGPGYFASFAGNVNVQQGPNLLVATGPKAGAILKTRGATARFVLHDVHFLPGRAAGVIDGKFFDRLVVGIEIEARNG